MDPNQLVLLIAALVVTLSFVINDVRRYIVRKVKIAYQMGLTAGANAARMFDQLTQPELVTRDIALVRGTVHLTIRIRAVSAGELSFLQRSTGGASVAELVSLGMVLPEMSVGDVRRLMPALEQHEIANAILELSGLTMDEAR